MSTANTIQIVKSGSNVTLSWAGGSPCFQLQQRADLGLGTPWVNSGNATLARSKTVAITGDQGYFRVQEQILMSLSADQSVPNQTRLFWNAPDVT